MRETVFSSSTIWVELALGVTAHADKAIEHIDRARNVLKFFIVSTSTILALSPIKTNETEKSVNYFYKNIDRNGYLNRIILRNNQFF